MMKKAQKAKSGDLRRRFFLGNLTAAGIVGITNHACHGPTTARTAHAPKQVKDQTKKAEFGLPKDLVYLNCGSLGPCPLSVINATNEAWRTLEVNPVHQAYGPLRLKMEEVRQQTARFLGCEQGELALTQNATEAMNAIAQGIGLQAGQRVLTSDQEHPGGSVCWDYFTQRDGVKVDKFKLGMPPKDEDEILGLIKEGITPETRVISLSHVTYPTGIRMPLRRIAKLSQSKSILFVVDGAQAPGMLPVNLHELDCDAYAASCHKWMLAPKGTGLLFINQRARKEIQPLSLFSGPAAYSASSGTRNIPSIIGLGAAIDYLESKGVEQVERHGMKLRQRLSRGLKKLPKTRVVSPASGSLASPMISFTLNSKEPYPVAQVLKETRNVVVKVASSPGFHGFRISPHLYNDEEDVDLLVDALKEILG